MKAPDKVLVAIIAITTLAVVALFKGIDGAVLCSAFTLLGGLGGYKLGSKSSTTTPKD